MLPENKHEYFQHLPSSKMDKTSLAIVPSNKRHKRFKQLNEASLNTDTLALITNGKHKDEFSEYLNLKKLRKGMGTVKEAKEKESEKRTSEKNKKADKSV